MNKKTESKCVGAMLTVGFHSANPPLIWRFDLERNHSFTLSLQGEEGDWELGITTPKGDFYPVVHFSAREDAEEALLKVEKTLASRGPRSLVVKAVLTVLVLAFLVMWIASAVGHYLTATKSTPALATPLTSTTPQPEQGMPQSADDVLKAPH